MIKLILQIVQPVLTLLLQHLRLFYLPVQQRNPLLRIPAGVAELQ